MGMLEERKGSWPSTLLTGMDDISAAGELGVRLNYVMGDVTGYGAVRKGLGGHHGVTGQPKPVDAWTTAPGLTSCTRPAACSEARDTPPR